MGLDDDLLGLQRALASIEHGASALPWAPERPWRTRTHLGVTDGRVALDLHDLSVRLALDAVGRALEVELSTGGLVLITGRGKHAGGRSTLRDAVLAELEGRARRGDLTFHPSSPGRITVVVDAARSRASRPGLGPLFWLVVALGVAGLLAALFG